MPTRLDLQQLLVTLLGSNNVYFQPPSNLQMEYPCIVYRRDDIEMEHADNTPYKNRTRYLVTVIDRDPDSDIPRKIGELPLVAFDRFYTADNLNHDVYRMFF